MSAISIHPNAPVRQRHSADRRQKEIVAAVLILVLDVGVEAVTTQRIADRLGLTQGAIFRHFSTKEAIWSSVLDWLQARLVEVFEPEPGASPLAQVARIFNAYMELFATYPAVPRLFFSDTFHHPYPRLHERLQAMVRKCEESLAQLIAQAVEADKVGEEVSPSAAAKLLLTSIQGVAFQSCVLGIVRDPVATGRQLFPLYLAALGAPRK
jgi:TetR/AcrR family transcriptional regulator